MRFVKRPSGSASGSELEKLPGLSSFRLHFKSSESVMKKPGGKPEPKKDDQMWCECECANCDIGAHERCHSPKCHMPEAEGRQSQDAQTLTQVFLVELTELGLNSAGE